MAQDCLLIQNDCARNVKLVSSPSFCKISSWLSRFSVFLISHIFLVFAVLNLWNPLPDEGETLQKYCFMYIL